MSLIMVGAVAPVLAAEGEGHFPPKAEDFWLPLWQVGGFWITRPMVLVAISVLLLCTWLLLATRQLKVVPGKGQWITEQVYDFVRVGISKDMIGSRDYKPFVPFLFSLFIFILCNNLFGIVPFLQFPTMSRIGFPIGLVAIVYVLYHAVGIRRKGLGGYFSGLVPGGLPGWIKPVIFLLELLTYFIIRPLTLALRLFGNMFAGHMLLVVFIVGGWELLANPDILMKLVAIPTYLLAFIMTLFEALVQFLQAYVFTLLAASYIADAVSENH